MIERIVFEEPEFRHSSQLLLDPESEFFFDLAFALLNAPDQCIWIFHLKETEVDPCLQQIWGDLDIGNGNHSAINHIHSHP